MIECEHVVCCAGFCLPGVFWLWLPSFDSKCHFLFPALPTKNKLPTHLWCLPTPCNWLYANCELIPSSEKSEKIHTVIWWRKAKEITFPHPSIFENSIPQKQGKIGLFHFKNPYLPSGVIPKFKSRLIGWPILHSTKYNLPLDNWKFPLRDLSISISTFWEVLQNPLWNGQNPRNRNWQNQISKITKRAQREQLSQHPLWWGGGVSAVQTSTLANYIMTFDHSFLCKNSWQVKNRH
jgi:hypothetical protein